MNKLGYEIHTGHPCLYDALHTAAAFVDAHSYLEIGVSDGASLLAALDSHTKLSRIVLCDGWQSVEGGAGRGSHEHIRKLLIVEGYNGEVEYLDGDSHALIPNLDRTRPFDLILIDGDHTAEGAARDLADTWPLLRPGGVLLFDDFERPHLAEVFNKFFASHDKELDILFSLQDGGDATTAVSRRAA